MRNVKRVTALALAGVMALSLGVSTPNQPAFAEETESKLSELEAVLFNNLPENLKFDGEVKSVDVSYQVRNTPYAYIHDTAVACYLGDKTAKADTYNINDDNYLELFVRHSKNKKYEIYCFDPNTYDVPLMKTVKNVLAIYEQSKKKQIVIYQKSGKKKTYTAYKKSGKNLKKVVSYSYTGKKYKKNSKKITKKTFNKYVKTLSKLSKIKPTKIDDKMYGGYQDATKTHMEKDYYVNSIWDYEDLIKYTHVFSKDDAGNYVSYGFDNILSPTDEGGNLEEIETPTESVRALFGPKIASDKLNGDTYQHADWKRLLQMLLGDKAAVCPELRAKDAPDGAQRALDFDKEALDGDVTSEEVNETNGDDSTIYKAIRYKYHYTDMATKVTVFAEGPYAGYIHDITTYTSSNGSDPYESTEFEYNKEPEGQLFDPLITTGCIGTVDQLKEMGAPIRSITIEAANIPGYTDTYRKTISVANTVKFVPATYTMKAQFYTIGEGGKKVEIAKGDEGITYDEKLNPKAGESAEVGDLYADADFPNGFYWEPKQEQ